MRWFVVFPAVLAVASCDEPDVHILTGQLYDPAAACIGPSEGVDVVAGPSTGDNCGPTCLTIASTATSGTTTAVYVTTVCPPFPGDYTVEALDATDGDGDPCTGAFAAYEANGLDGDICGPDAAEGEGGAPGDAGTDAAGDAGGDAPGDAPDAG
jgi:hypothetical protein